MKQSLFRKSLIGTAVAIAFGGAAPAFAANFVTFDPTGNGMLGTNVGKFTWGFNAVLAQNGFTNATPVGSVTISGGFLEGQGLLSNYTTPGGSVSNSSFTYVFKIPVDTTRANADLANAAGTASKPNIVTFDSVANFGANNYFRMYAITTAPDLVAGTGFDTGHLILDGKVDIAAAGSNFTITNGTEVSIQGTGGDGGPGTTTQSGVPIVTVTGSGTLNLNIDVCQASELAGVGATVACSGGVVGTKDTKYWIGDITSLGLNVSLTDDLDYNSNIVDPLKITVPALINGVLPNFGLVNGGKLHNNFTCDPPTVGGAPCDMIYGAQAGTLNLDHNSVIPEPGSLALLGLGLFGMGFGAKRKKRA